MAGTDGEKRDTDFRARLLGEFRVLNMHASALATNPSLADDLVQDTLERALRHQRSFSRGTSLRPWLMTIMRNLFIDRCREKIPLYDIERCEAEAKPEPEPEPLRPSELLGNGDLTEALRHLGAPLRKTFVLAYFHHLTYGEIAARTAVRVSTVGTRLLRARGQLRELLLDRLTVSKGEWRRRASAFHLIP